MSIDKIALITDSACDLPRETLQELNAWMIPLKIIYKNKVYNDRVDIQPQEVYDNLSKEIPTTSMMSPDDTRSLFEKLQAKGFTHVIAIHISSGLSGTYESVKMVAQQFNNIKIEVIDSKFVSLSQGFLVQEASRSIQNGLSFDKVISLIHELQKKINIFFVLKTMEYLKKGGRIGYIQGTVGQILDIKPIISINDEGKYFSLCKVRGRKKSINKLLEILKEQAAGKTINLAIAHSNAKEEAEKLLQSILNMGEFTVKETLFNHISPVLGVHAGPGLIGLSYYEV